MVYTSVIAGATGIYYFAREDADATPPVVHGYGHVGSAQPRSSYMWSEARWAAVVAAARCRDCRRRGPCLAVCVPACWPAWLPGIAPCLSWRRTRVRRRGSCALAPRAPRRIAFELAELGPSLISNRTRPAATSSAPSVEVGAWEEADGSTLVIAVNLAAEPLPSMQLRIAPREAPATATAALLFGTAARGVATQLAADSSVTITDTVDALSTRIYRLPPPASRPQPQAVAEPTRDAHASNLVFNGGFEASSSGPGTADGSWAAWGGDAAATIFTDSARRHSGTHSMRMTTPQARTSPAPPRRGPRLLGRAAAARLSQLAGACAADHAPFCSRCRPARGCACGRFRSRRPCW